MKINWKASITHPAGPVLGYVVQVKEKDDPLKLKTCTQIEAFSSSFTCVLDDLKKDTVYVVQIAAKNIVGFSEFTEKEIRTKDTGDDERKGTIHIHGKMLIIVIIITLQHHRSKRCSWPGQSLPLRVSNN